MQVLTAATPTPTHAVAARPDGAASNAAALGLSRWLRALWNVAPSLHFDAEQAYIADGSLHLPKADLTGPPSAHAAAAHAAAHLVYSPPVFDGRGVRPIVRALMGVLEDARIETLACRELPGLRRLWTPRHQASPDDGDGFEALLGRLARGLADADYIDPHPWIAKGRRLFFLDPAQQVSALNQPRDLRAAATRLGHDIGQMRLQFNSRLYRPVPAYRDDNRWMWPQHHDARTDPAPPPPAPRPQGLGEHIPDEAPAAPPLEPTQRHPEWDHRIERLRPQWCAVFEAREPLQRPTDGIEGTDDIDGIDDIGRNLSTSRHGFDDHPLRTATRRALTQALRRARATPHAAHQLAADGDRFDLDALLRARIAQRVGDRIDPRVHRRVLPPPVRGAVVVLVDQSASSVLTWAGAHDTAHPEASPSTGHPTSLLQTASLSAALLVDALQSAGLATQLCGFSSEGRHRVQLQEVLAFGEALDAAALQRLDRLRSTGSTRLGAVLRHAAWRLAQPTSGLASRVASRTRRWVLLVSDGQPHDIDVHDPRYLGIDARMAVRHARRQGIQMACLSLPVRGSGAGAASDGAAAQAARQIFGAARVAGLDRLERLPARIAQLVAACAG